MMFQYFDGNLTHQVLYLYILLTLVLNVRDLPWRYTYIGAELASVSAFVAGMFLLKIHFRFYFFVFWSISTSILQVQVTSKWLISYSASHIFLK